MKLPRHAWSHHVCKQSNMPSIYIRVAAPCSSCSIQKNSAGSGQLSELEVTSHELLCLGKRPAKVTPTFAQSELFQPRGDPLAEGPPTTKGPSNAVNSTREQQSETDHSLQQLTLSLILSSTVHLCAEPGTDTMCFGCRCDHLYGRVQAPPPLLLLLASASYEATAIHCWLAYRCHQSDGSLSCTLPGTHRRTSCYCCCCLFCFACSTSQSKEAQHRMSTT